ncbi:hypothetical protein [Corynebacterium sp. ACRQP]|uniref:hypothetical protein n=1 Tax=Corynebacterium sp. ACRQP TaxID=2918195 RepID=UPI001EF6E5F9|nr:hypothetical protein [Corynebacterium sp. ACRQP]MCG7236118.1 hypothetical protein [Corynebacterium sp. ACRQP]
MSLISWLGLGFVALLAIGGIVALGNTSKEIYESDMEEDSKRRWGFLMGFSPLAGLYAYKRRNELFGHGERPVDEPGRGGDPEEFRS